MSFFTLHVLAAVLLSVAANLEDQNTISEIWSRGQVARHVGQMTWMSSVCMGNPNKGYISYGCFCGLGGKGTPVDEVDKCCKIHDDCYGDATNAGCTWIWSPHSVTYVYDCDSGQKTIHCKDRSGTCTRRACECDKEVVYCFHRTRHIYNQKYYKYDQRKCIGRK